MVQFILENAFLGIATAALGGATIYLWAFGGDKRALDCEAAVAAINFENAQVIDVRGSEEFDKGHIPGAKRMDPDAAKAKLPAMAKKKPVLLVCAKGAAAADVARKLRADGVENSYTLKGGMASWQQDGKPLARKRQKA